MGTERDALMDAAYTARERLIKKIDQAIEEYDQFLGAVYSKDVGFHPDLAEESKPHATEADVLQALNVTPHPSRPGFTPTHFADLDSDIRDAF